MHNWSDSASSSANDGRPKKRLWTGLLLLQAGFFVVLLEAGVRLVAWLDRDVDNLLALPTVASRFDDARTLPELLRRTPLGWSPHATFAGFPLNARSFRTHDYERPREPDTLRVMVLGDSYSFASGGVAFDAMWHSRAAQQLARDRAARGGPETKIFALGVPGVGPMFERRLWQLEHDRVDPDLVVLAFFVGNDFAAFETKRERWRQSDESSWMVRQSATVRLVRNILRLRAARRQTADPVEIADDAAAAADPERERPAIELPERRFWSVLCHRLMMHAKTERPQFDRLAGRAIDTIETLAREVESTGTDFLVLLLPEDFQVTPTTLDRCLERRGLDVDDIDLDLLQRALESALTARGIDVVDLLPTMRDRGADEDLYWDTNLHWNVAGNRVAGAAFAEALSRRLLGRPLHADSDEP